MHFQFLIEDQSSAILVEILMQKIAANRPSVTFDCKPFKGIGGLTRKNTAKETKSGKLLNDLATYLRGFDRSLKHIPAAIMIVVDNDQRDTAEFLAELQEVSHKNMVTLDHEFCIAVEEVEAWLLGDEGALTAAYPSAKRQVLQSYEQDSICGTWELLADAVYPGGLVKFMRDCPTYIEKGNYKCEWARKIGQYMDPMNNRSPSFQKFVSEICKRIPAA